MKTTDLAWLTFSSCNLQTSIYADLDIETYGRSLACRIIIQPSPALSEVLVALFSSKTIWLSCIQQHILRITNIETVSGRKLGVEMFGIFITSKILPCTMTDRHTDNQKEHVTAQLPKNCTPSLESLRHA